VHTRGLARPRKALPRRRRVADACAALQRVADAIAGAARSRAAAARSAALALALAASLSAPLQACAALADAAEAAAQLRNDAALSGGERAFRPLSAAEAASKRALFTPDAFAGMLALSEYATFVESVRAAEAAPGCEACATERRRLERAWQTVGNEAYSGEGAAFSQATWGAALLPALRDAGGLLRTPDETAAAVRAMVASGVRDPYSSYLSPSEWRAALRRPQRAEREYAAALAVAVGIQLGEETPAHSGWRVAAPLAGSPAEEGGVGVGDVLLAVDGTPTAGLDAAAVSGLLRGPDGSTATLTLQPRAGVRSRAPPRTLTLTRRPLPLPPTSTPELLSLPNGRGTALLLRIRYFSSDGTAELAKTLRYGESVGVSGYVLDLRNNPGGVLEEAIASAALFAPCGARLAQTHRGGAGADVRYVACALPPGQFASPPSAPLTRGPLVLLVNQGSASAAEAFAAAMRDAASAQLVGTRTFGKSQVQFFFPLADGGGLRLTVLHWRTPRRGDDVARVPRGLAPDAPCADHPRAAGDAPDACTREALKLLTQPRAGRHAAA
jgi:carboxyl-terminal processing protease